MKILYVENHAVFAATVRNQFLAQHAVAIVPDLSAAAAALRDGVFDLFLVDFDLDDGKGDEFVRGLRASGNQAPVIGVSSHDEGNAALLKAGASAICNKMQFDRIQEIIDGITEKRNREV